jgi:putative transcriptional regulator
VIRPAIVGSLVVALSAGVIEPGAGQPIARVPLSPGTFLVATHDLLDPNFSKTVVLLLQYSTDGAMGIVVNRRTDLKVFELLEEIEDLEKLEDSVFLGGPVAPEELLVLIRTREEPEDSVRVLDDVWVSQSLDLLEQLARKRSRKKGAKKKSKNRTEFRVYAGYAGWAPYQLDAEVARGDWLVVQADGDTVFSDNPPRVWRSLAPVEDNPLVTEAPSILRWTSPPGAVNR